MSGFSPFSQAVRDRCKNAAAYGMAMFSVVGGVVLVENWQNATETIRTVVVMVCLSPGLCTTQSHA